MKFIKKLIYWLLPIVILSYVFTKIDFNQLTSILKNSDPTLILLGILMFQVSVSIGALRWFFLLERKISFFYLLKHYWIGLSLGIFMPASIGWDAYRVTIAGRKYGQYIRQISLIIWEKIISLLNVLIIILLLYPFLSLSYFQKTLDDLYYLVITAIIVVAFIILLLRKTIVKKILTLFMEKFKSTALGILKKLHKYLPTEKYEFFKIFKSTLSVNFFINAFIFSLFIQFSSSLAAQLFFMALDYEISFLVNLFVTPVLFFIFILPVSFGGLGVREASFIMLYHLFGVPIEIALIVSFLGLIAILINVAIGGIIMWINKKDLL